MNTVLRASTPGRALSGLWDMPVFAQPTRAIAIPGDTVPEMFWNGVTKRGDTVFMRQKEFGLWRSWTWTQTGDAVREIAHGLMALGFEVRDTASILAHTVVEWVLADMAVLSCGGVSNGISPTDAPGQVHSLCEDPRPSGALVADEVQAHTAP